MSNNLTPKELQVKMAGTALECGTLSVFLSLLQAGAVVFVSPITIVVSAHHQSYTHYAVHITTRSSHTSPILYGTFHSATVAKLARTERLIEPYVQQEKAAITTERLQQEMQQVLMGLIKAHPMVSQVVTPARFRIPDAWAWSVRSSDRRILLKDGQWTVDEEQQQS